MTLGTFEPDGFHFTNDGGLEVLKELEDQIDEFIAEQVADELNHILEKEEHNAICFEGQYAVFEVLYENGELYSRKTSILEMAGNITGLSAPDPEDLQETAQALRKAASMIDEYLSGYARRK